MPPIPAMTMTSDPVTSATSPEITTTAADPAITVAEAVQLASALSIFVGKNKQSKEVIEKPKQKQSAECAAMLPRFCRIFINKPSLTFSLC